jgi:uncharacterized protein YndB with AHSA1/START domain
MKILNEKIFPKIEVTFNQKAYEKMQSLIHATKLEVAWHGIVEREDNKFTVTDILCYPQEGNSVHVESDDDEYPLWLMERTDDEINNMRMQGHSHVNMSVSPSGADTHNQTEIITQVKDYYIFMIMNKSNNIWINVVDLETNLIYEAAEIKVIRPTSWGEQQVKEQLSDMKNKVTKLKTNKTKTSDRYKAAEYTKQSDESVEEYVERMNVMNDSYRDPYGNRRY